MASQLRNLCTEVKTHQNCDLAKNMAKYAKNGQNYTPLFFIWAHYGTQKVWNDFGNVKFFLSGFTWNHPDVIWQNQVCIEVEGVGIQKSDLPKVIWFVTMAPPYPTNG